REAGEVSPRLVAARRATRERPAAPPPPEVPDLKGARARIVKLYVRLAEQLARWGVRRERFQTPLEFSQVLAPAQAAARLTELFDRARYGDRDLGEPEVEAASSAGTQILDHFRRRP
ncbi:MAG TPA: DUF4129 domain-containing protein, partial [Planctomycetota bacterium]|nr:DUF4129 domain-containing protein [Planctomycetota bacterium]